jgi:glycosyltransferase involved in cell wall biosynthesis
MCITFIIPTIGRDTLQNSINSLLNQTWNQWRAIIIFDGIEINQIKNNYDDRIEMIKTDKKLGQGINSAGLVRNYGLSFVKTEWIAFLDDDDIIAPDYIETFYNEIERYPETDLLIFRMKLMDRIIPKLDIDNFYLCDVGISFIINRKIYDHNILFTPDGAEDYLFLDKVRYNGCKIMISPYIKYFVRNDHYDETDTINKQKGKRILLNF